MADIFHYLFAQSGARLARSTIMRDLGWLVALLVVGTVGGAEAGVPMVVTYVIGAVAVIAVVIYLILYPEFTIFKTEYHSYLSLEPTSSR